MSEIWYRINSYDITIEEVEVVKATGKTLQINNGRRTERANIYSDYYRHYETLEEAIEYLRERCERNLNYARKQLATAESENETIQNNIPTVKKLRKAALLPDMSKVPI